MRFLVIGAALMLAACAPEAGKAEGGKVAEAAASAAAGDGGERFYGERQFTIVMSHSGRQTGVTTTHVRDWGRKRAEITDTSLSVAGFSQRSHTRAVFEGARIVTINLDTNAATATTNPLYDQIVAAMRGRSGVEFGEQMMTQMGGRKTGESGTFAGHACEYWEIASLGSRTCVTPWGGTLHLTTNMAGISLEQTATEVRMGDGGPDEAFAYDPATVTEGPDLGAALNRLKQN